MARICAQNDATAERNFRAERHCEEIGISFCSKVSSTSSQKPSLSEPDSQTNSNKHTSGSALAASTEQSARASYRDKSANIYRSTGTDPRSVKFE